MYLRVFLTVILLAVTDLHGELQIYTALDSQASTIFCSYDSTTQLIAAGRINANAEYVNYSTLISKLRRKIRLAKNTRNNKTLLNQLKNKLKKMDRQNLYAEPICIAARSSSPTPSPSPSPSTIPSCSGNYDDQGNTCANRFEIPNGLIGNISRGQQIQQLRCNGCHMERTFYKYRAVWTAVQTIPNMNGTLNGYNKQQAIADLVAYLNRFSQ